MLFFSLRSAVFDRSIYHFRRLALFHISGKPNRKFMAKATHRDSTNVCSPEVEQSTSIIMVFIRSSSPVLFTAASVLCELYPVPLLKERVQRYNSVLQYLLYSAVSVQRYS